MIILVTFVIASETDGKVVELIPGIKKNKRKDAKQTRRKKSDDVDVQKQAG